MNSSRKGKLLEKTMVKLEGEPKKIKDTIELGTEIILTERNYIEMAKVFSKMLEFEATAKEKLPENLKAILTDINALNLEIVRRSPINNLSFEQVGINAEEVKNKELKKYIEILVNDPRTNADPMTGKKAFEQVIDGSNQFNPKKLMAINTKFYVEDDQSLYVVDNGSVRKATNKEIKNKKVEKISVTEAKKKVDEIKLKIVEAALKTMNTFEMVQHLQNIGMYASQFAAAMPYFLSREGEALLNEYKEMEQARSVEDRLKDRDAVPTDMLNAVQSIQSSAITHAQRIPRYEMLIQGIQKKQGPENAELISILDKINMVNEEVVKAKVEDFPDPLLRVFYALNAEIAKEPNAEKRYNLQKQLLSFQVKKINGNDEFLKRKAFEQAAEAFIHFPFSQGLNVGHDRQAYIERNIARFVERNLNESESEMQPQEESEMQIQAESGAQAQEELEMQTQPQAESGAQPQAESEMQAQPQVTVKNQQAREEQINITEVELPVLHDKLKKDERISKTFKSMEKAQARLDKFRAKKKTGMLARWADNYFSKKVDKFAAKRAYILRLNKIAHDYSAHKKNEGMVEASGKIAGYDNGWQKDWLGDFERIKDYVPPGFELRKKELIDKINAIKKNEFDIDKFEELSKELIKNAAYKHKYKSHNAMFHELMHDMQETERDQEKNQQDLARLHEELAIEVQKALIEAEKAKTKKILESKAPLFDMQAISGAMKPHFEKYATYANEAQTRLYRRKALHEQGKTQTLKSDIEKYMNPEENNSFFSRLKTKLKYKDVTKAYKEFARDFNQKTNALDLKIAETPHKIKAYHDQLLKVARKEWKKVKGKDLIQRPLVPQTDLIKQVCLMMINIHDTQSALLSQPSKASVVIDKTMYSDLHNLMNGSLLALVTSHQSPCPYREKLLEIMKTDGFKSAPKEVRNMVKKLNKVVKHNYEPQTKSWFFKKKPDKQAATKQDRVFNQAPPEINDDEIHGSRRNSRSSSL